MNAGMKLGKTTRSVLLVLVALIVGGAIVLGGYWRWKYPYGRSHCCIIQMMFALARYADGTVIYTLSFSNLFSDALSVEFRDGVAVSEEITFRMKTVSSPRARTKQ
jgi:hypothetical protein